MRAMAPLGRVLFALVFVFGAVGDFSRPTIDYAAHSGVPEAHVLVPVAGLLSLVGGLMVMLGLQARLGAALLILFLVPVTLLMHRFWAVSDPQMRQIQFVNFMKNLSLLGGATLILYFGAGPMSVDAWLARRRAPTPPVLTTPTPA